MARSSQRVLEDDVRGESPCWQRTRQYILGRGYGIPALETIQVRHLASDLKNARFGREYECQRRSDVNVVGRHKVDAQS